MTRKMTLRKKVHQSAIPLMFGIPAKDRAWLREVPYVSLKRIKEGTGCGTDWYNIAFRCQVGLNLVRMDYAQETIDQFKEQFDIFFNSIKHYKEEESVFFTPEELEAVESLLEATDEITENLMRKFYIKATHKVFQQIDTRLASMDVVVKAVKGKFHGF